MLTQIQDRGRFGYGDIGITQSGMADGYSGAWANRLLFNDADDAVLEILLGGVAFVSEVESTIAVTGAQASLTINGITQALWRSHSIYPDDKIEIGMATKGLRVYLAIQGGFSTTQALESHATTRKEGFGEKITPDTLLLCRSSSALPITSTPEHLIPTFRDVIILRVLLGYQSDTFTAQAKEQLFGASYRVSNSTDRMGCRLEGRAITYEGGELISEPIAYGSIQIPADGQPIILLNERQTIGGYPKIGSIIPMDCYRLAQAKPSTTVAFQEIGLEEAVRATRELMGFVAIS
jgi:biotin-dependent carboxylase-like uncharacterized protein